MVGASLLEEAPPTLWLSDCPDCTTDGAADLLWRDQGLVSTGRLEDSFEADGPVLGERVKLGVDIFTAVGVRFCFASELVRDDVREVHELVNQTRSL